MKLVHNPARGLKLILLLFAFACSTSAQQDGSTENTAQAAIDQGDEVINYLPDTLSLPDSAFVNLAWFEDAFVYDLRYATANNFTGKVVYPCAECKIRFGVAKALLRVADGLRQEGGYRIKFYDCYRPVSVQRTFWEIYPDARYVANPNTTGSVHNKGAAVDITLVDSLGQELDMGTGYDHFGVEAHHDYVDLPAEVLANRRRLKTALEAEGFHSIRTEWWHYNYQKGAGYGLADEPLCE